MKCAVSFLSVVVLVVAVGATAIYIFWMMEDCKNNHFFCAKDDKCIPFTKLCNGRRDCSDGTDELKHVCSDITGMHTYVIHIQTYARNNDTVNSTIETAGNETMLEQIFNNSMVTCDISVPLSCNCTSETTALCSSTQWSTIPWQEFDNSTKKLILNNSLDENGRYGWENGTASSMTRLRSLVIENHRQKAGFPWDLIHQNPGLVNIYIENNGIETLQPGIFKGLTELKMLQLSKNELTYVDEEAITNLPILGMLNLSRNNLTVINCTFKGLTVLFDLNLAYNRITVIHPDMFKEVVKIKYLELQGNLIESIDEKAFAYNQELLYLNLENNRITTLKPLTFAGLSKVDKLNIHNNPLPRISMNLLCPLISLQSLNLTGYDIDLIDTSVFNCFKNLHYVHFKKFSYCRFVPKVPFCYPSSDGLSSRDNLLVAPPLRLFIWIMAVLAIVGNITVLVSRWGNRRKRGILDVFVNNLAGADMLTGIYLITLASMDIQFRDKFKMHAHEWSTSWLCSAIGILTMISCEVSILILTIMSLERYLVISGPFSAPKLSKTLAWVSMSIIWVFITILALTPLYEWKGSETFYGSSGLCFPLHLDDPFSTGWEFSAFVFVGLNSICLILIAISYGKLFYVIRQTRMSTPIFIRDMEMAFRFFLMVVTDFICWLPIIAFKVAVLYGYEISEDLHSWFLIIVLPLNSVVNPFLYTFSTGTVRSKFVQRILKMVPRINHLDGNQIHTFRNVGHTSDTPLYNSTLLNKRQDGGHICSLTHQDSVTSK
ncbi:unnamed protein product [Allacma fusca]|uniref:G-protein coupled receptors family 1 profile domain-containing protein n=1 Tax=Allacma fusca TaxID=39272 RepID=A0A8J2KYI4_9HEXA|nr:unnamed protein product [Allacma fusca]